MILKDQLEKLAKEYPLVLHTDAGRLFSTVRRMKAEKKTGIPIFLRTGFAISTKNGKAANAMTEDEWEEFYNALSERLRGDYPEWRLPPKVLAAEIYRNLVDLLDDPVPAKFLHHTGSITDLLITGIHRLPADLRTAAIMAMFNQIDDMIWFVDGLRVLASRAGLRFDTLAHQIGALDQSNQIAATIRQVVDSLPLPATLPPAEIEGFRRLDTVAEIRELAKNWRNCLAGYLFSVNDGTSAIYLSEQLEAVCFVCRHGRMGWFLVQTKGPRNADIDPNQLAQIHAAFADAGIPEAAIIDPIKSIIQTGKWSRQVGDQEVVFDDIVLH